MNLRNPKMLSLCGHTAAISASEYESFGPNKNQERSGNW